MYTLTNVTMSSNYTVATIGNNGMRTLSLDELDFISGGAWTWDGLGGAMVVGAFAGGMAGAVGGFAGMGMGAAGGGLIGGAAYLLSTYIAV